MNTLGIALNHQVRGLTTRHRNEGWNMVGDLTAPFEPHRYCADDHWFNRRARSIDTQGNEDGTAHPNRRGHLEYARIIGRAIVLGQPTTPFREVTITVTAVKLRVTGAEPRSIPMTLIQYQNDLFGLFRTVSVARNGAWNPIPPALGVFPTLPVFQSPAAPRHATELRLVVDNRFSIHHSAADGYGSGCHEVSVQNGSIAVRYQVAVTTPGAPPAATSPCASPETP